MPFHLKNLPVQTPLRDLRGIFGNIIPKINKAFHKIHYTTTKDIFNIITRDLVSVDILENSFKTIYIVAMERKKNPKIWEQKWYNELNILELEWTKIWDNLNNGYVDYKVQSSIWQLIHRNFISGYILNKMYRNDGKCKLCKTIESKRQIFLWTV